MSNNELPLTRAEKRVKQNGRRLVRWAAKISNAVLDAYDNLDGVEASIKFEYRDDPSPVTLSIFFYGRDGSHTINIYCFYTEGRIRGALKDVLGIVGNRSATMAEVEATARNFR